MSVLYDDIDKSFWLYQPQLTRWRVPFRGPRSSLRTSQESNQIAYDLHKMSKRAADLKSEIDSFATEVYEGKDYSGQITTSDTVTTLDPIAMWSVSNYSGTGPLLDESGNGHDFAFPGGNSDPLFLDHDGENYVYLPGIANNFISTPDHSSLDITGDIDLRVELTMTNWANGSVNFLVGKWMDTLNQGSYLMWLGATGGLTFIWRVDGTAGTQTGYNSNISVPFGPNTRGWVRATMDVDNGSGGRTVTFYTSIDGENWTQLGISYTFAGTTSLYSGTAALSIGAYNGGTAQPMSGIVHRAQVRNGINGTVVADFDASQANQIDTTDSVGKVWTVHRNTTNVRRAAVVDRPMLQLAVDDYLSSPNSPDFSFDQHDSFTLIALVRQHSNLSSYNSLLATRQVNGAGWELSTSSDVGVFSARMTFGDVGGPYSDKLTSPLPLGDLVTIYGRKDAPTLTTTVGSSAIGADVYGADESEYPIINTNTLKLGARYQPAAHFSNLEFFGAAIFRYALTDAEIVSVTSALMANVDIRETPVAGNLLGIDEITARIENLRHRIRGLE